MSSTVENTLNVLVHKLFDYAGMFPPAALSFDMAMKESASLRTTLHRPWMIASDIVLDVRHAQLLSRELLASYGFIDPLRVCLLGTESYESIKALVVKLTKEDSRVKITSLEVKVSTDSLASTLSAIGALTEAFSIPLALEPDLSDSRWQGTLERSISALASVPTKPALKCRLTGPTGISPEKLGAAIAATSDANLPFKVTGGLHHPIVEKSRYPFPMGFLNVAAAVMFRRHIGTSIGDPSLVDLLTNEDSAALSLGESLKYKGLSMTLEELQQVKAATGFTIGSCSLSEPDQDLTRLFPHC